MVVLVSRDGNEALVVNTTVKLSVIGNAIYAFTDLNNEAKSFGAVKLAEYRSDNDAKKMLHTILDSISYGKKVIRF